MIKQDLVLKVDQDNEKIVKERSKLQEMWTNKLIVQGLEDNLHTMCDQQTSFIYLFREAFSSDSLPVHEMRILALAGQLFASSLVLSDEVMDWAYIGINIASLLGIQARQFESYHLLYQIFPPNATFWQRFRGYLSQYTQACLEENDFISGKRPWSEYTESVAIQSIKGRTGVAKTAIAGLVELAQEDKYLTQLEESISNFYVANQMLDDLFDWKEDLQTGIPSLLLSRLIDKSPHQYSQEQLEELRKKLNHKIYYQGHANYVLELALKYLDQAEILKEELPELLWWNVTSKLRHQCQTLIEDIAGIVQKNLERAKKQPKFTLTLPPAASEWQQLSWDGLDFIIKQWQLGFGEARHIMVFPQEQGFSSSQEYQYGDVFQRALIADALCDVDEQLGGLLQPLLKEEVNYLLNCQRTTGIGGWSYFPDLPELSPDADDLAQIMQVLFRLGHGAEIVKFCETPLKFLLEDCAYPDGSFETWIIPQNQRTPEQETQAKWAKEAWGTGPDTDVIANLVYALWLYDSQRFSYQIKQGITYLESQQQADGSWLSSWYHGPYYGTYVCLRLLAATKPDSPAISRASNFLKTHQHSDGGWGLTEDSDSLSTALSLLGLAAVAKLGRGEENNNLATPALSFLQSCQQPDKAWENCQFIRMEVGRASGQVYQILSYGSRTITSTFVMKAANAWHQLSRQITS
ncbi:MAG: prenyltransferase/squalene oxidase repeat-containing protein [Microcystis sp.]|uniref:prenyltransferase/squalene oxidase repeat-containing protein n=1 Tax=Microcystis sp. TaxID=1127 RepID=UPI00391A1FEA